MTELTDMSADAMSSGIRADLELITDTNQMARYALISDKEWPRAVTGMIAPLLPSVEIDVFTPD
jgi:hypothetical protein